MDEHCRGCIRYMKSCSGMSKRLCEKHKLRIPITNADRIRAMTDEELAKHLCNIRNAERCVISGQKRCMMFDDCIACWTDWMKQEAK